MKKIDVITLFDNLSKINSYEGHTFNYAIIKNISKLKIEVEIYNKEATRVNDIRKEFEDERIKLCELHSNKDEKGKAKIIKDSEGTPIYDIIDTDKYNIELKELQEKHKESIDKFKAASEDLEKHLQEDEVDFEIYFVKLKDVPSNIKTEDMDRIFKIVREEEDLK